jgi:nitrite reductase/ring-hydroxylating ferredoxin subunit
MADYVAVAKVRELGAGDMLRLIVNHVPVCLYNVAGRYYATQDTCTHAEASLADGELDNEVVTCPLHGAAFNVCTGAVLSFPATFPLTTYPVKVEGDQVLVLVED